MADFFSNISEALQGLHWTEVGAVIFGSIYIYLAVKKNIWCWFWGILSCTLWAWATYNIYAYYVDAVLNVFYIVMSFVGIYQWKFGSQTKEELPISRLTIKENTLIILGGIILTLIFGYLFEKYTPARATYLDSFTTAFAIFATFMTIQKKIDNWIYWIVIDVLYVYLYWTGGALLFMMLYMIYAVMAVKGFFEWKKEMNPISA